MSKREYLSLTLVEVSRLLRYKEKIRRRECEWPSGRIETRMANMFRNEEEHPDAFTVYDILPFLDETSGPALTPAQSEEEIARKNAERMLNKARGIVMRLGGTIEIPK